MLIDDSRGLVCLDEAMLMEKDLRGERIPLWWSISPVTGTRLILLQVDSGSDGAILYAGNKDLEQPLLRQPSSSGQR
jgi:hypothetical protein